MTAQIQDRVEFDGVDYALVGIDGAGPFDPADHGVAVQATSTANYRGYQACYTVRDGLLLLADLNDVGLELILDGGRVVRTHDHSAEVAGLRAAILGGDRPNPDTGAGPASWIARSFERNYARNLGR